MKILDSIFYWFGVVAFCLITLIVLVRFSFTKKALLNLFLSKGIISSSKKIAHEVNNKNLRSETVGELSGHIAIRLTRIGIFSILISSIPTILLYQQNNLIKIQNEKVAQQNYLIEVERNAGLVFLLNNIFDNIDSELKNDYGGNNKRDLSPQLQARIIALSKRFKPYQEFENELILGEKRSPEKNQLIDVLFLSDLDDKNLNEILRRIDFSYVNLSNISLTEQQSQNLEIDNCTLKAVGGDFTGMSIRNSKFEESIDFESTASSFENTIFQSTNEGIMILNHDHLDNSTIDISAPYSKQNEYVFNDVYFRNGKIYINNTDPIEIELINSYVLNSQIELKGLNPIFYNTIISNTPIIIDNKNTGWSQKEPSIYNTIFSTNSIKNFEYSIDYNRIPFAMSLVEKDNIDGDKELNSLLHELVFTNDVIIDKGMEVPFLIVLSVITHGYHFADLKPIVDYSYDNYSNLFGELVKNLAKYPKSLFLFNQIMTQDALDNNYNKLNESEKVVMWKEYDSSEENINSWDSWKTKKEQEHKAIQLGYMHIESILYKLKSEEPNLYNCLIRGLEFHYQINRKGRLTPNRVGNGEPK